MKQNTKTREQASKLNGELAYFCRYYEASNLTCGMIAARCRQRGDDGWEKLKKFVEAERPGIAVQVFYEEEDKRLLILMEDMNLANTHHLALTIKEYLQKQEQLAGSVGVGSYPESGNAIQGILAEMTARLTQTLPYHSGIQVIMQQEQKWERPPRLLLVEHDPVVQQILAVRLARNGYEIYLAQDGKEGKQKIQQIQPDLVITELTLPVMNGYQLIDWVQEQHEQADPCKIVVLTDRRLEEDMSQCFQKGVADFLTKPFSPVELDWRIKRLLVS
ncbi:response regulator [Brevibacillus ruminantium]|uniref:Response regulator n=1 Tax=Brevibacillus ruminantium TaxID=2950604 RepID=A0ABY4W8A4_9BACL|nr:response regulator [Brevibacillus ruminantium]USG63403.1 response regulator [Brevibacillus ruminantium]